MYIYIYTRIYYTDTASARLENFLCHGSLMTTLCMWTYILHILYIYIYYAYYILYLYIL